MRFAGTDEYVSTDDRTLAVNAAITLQRPLLIKLPLSEDIPAESLHAKDCKTIIPPLHGALLKNEQDVHLFERLVFMTRAKIA